MTRARTYLLARPWLIVAAGLAALCLRVLTPPGFMPVVEPQRIEVLVCHGAGAAPASVRLEVPANPAYPAGEDAAERCAFADLAMPLLGAVDPILLAAALAFVLALGLRALPAPALREHPRLRPPLRGPPVST